MTRLTIDTGRFFDLMVKPHFADLNPVGDTPGAPGAFTVMDNVPSKRKILDIIGGGAIIERKEASCDIQYKPVASLKPRTIEVDKLYGATTTCDEEFYAGCMEDFQNDSDVFVKFVIDWFGRLVKKDIQSNAFFGNIERGNDPNNFWSWNKYDGIFKWIARYIADGTIAAAQQSSIASGALTPTDCYNVIKWAYQNQTDLMAMLPEDMKAFYVSRQIAFGYREYLRQTSGAFNTGLYTGSTQGLLEYEGIPIVVEATWNPIMAALNGGVQANACILTIKGNFTWATDKTYGVQDENGDYVGFATWFNFSKQSWEFLTGLKAGTQLAYPELVVFASTAIS